MELAKTKALKERAKEYGKLIRNENVRTNDDYLRNMDELIDAVVFLSVYYQDDKTKKTLASSEWAQGAINKMRDLRRKYINLRVS